MSERATSREQRPLPVRPAGGFMGGGGPGRGVMGLVEKPKNFAGTMRDLLAYLKPHRLLMIGVFFLAIGSTVFAVLGPKILGQATNQLVNDYFAVSAYDKITASLPAGAKLPPGTTGATILRLAPPAALAKVPAAELDKLKSLDLSVRPSINFGKIEQLVWLLVGLYGASALLNFLQSWIMSGISQAVTYQFRRDISEKINRLPLSYFDTRSFGDVLSRVTNDVDTVSQTLNQSLTQIITAVTTIIGILIMMLTISPIMTLVAVVIVPLSFVLIGLIIQRSQHFFKEQQDSLGALNGHIEEMYGGHVVMRLFNGEQRSVTTFRGINTKLFGSAWQSQFLAGLVFPITQFVSNLSYVAVAVLGGYLAVKGRLQIGDIQAFIQYSNQFNQPIIQTANIASVLQSTAAAAERVFEFLGEAEEAPDPADAKAIDVAKVRGGVQFDHIGFRYLPDTPVIKGFSASVKPGQRIAIVGPTGAGKTTMVNLLMRFYEVNQGAISIDGTDTRQLKRDDVRRLFGMVLQDTWLFNGTIRENLAYGKPTASTKEIEAAAKLAHVDHFVKTLPQGYDFVLNEEVTNISQGEKQLLTIARAMLADPPMLILDEATSSVDTRTEVLIQHAMERLMKGKTSFVIAHRLSTIRDADLILVMRDGNIVEQGTHTQLLKKRGFYAELYNSQFTAPITVD